MPAPASDAAVLSPPPASRVRRGELAQLASVVAQAPPLEASRRSVAMRAAPWLVSAAVHLAVATTLALSVIVVVHDRPVTVHDILVLSQTPRQGELSPLSAEMATAVFAAPQNALPADAKGLPDSPAPAPTASSDVQTPMVMGLATGADDGKLLEVPVAPGMTPSVQRLRGGFYGKGGGQRADQVVFVIDRSGSMRVQWDMVKCEIASTIGGLAEDQCFGLVLFNDASPVEFAPSRLVAANWEQRQKAADFLAGVLSQSRERSTLVLPAMERAFEVLRSSPPGRKVVYLLTDGVFDDGDDATLLSAISWLNADRSVRIYTFLTEKDPPARLLLEKLAAQHGGEFTDLTRR